VADIVDSPGRPAERDDAAWAELLDRLYALSRKGMVLGLERVEGVMSALGDPHRAFDAVHVAGTNGKGSTAAYCATILAQSGLRVGLFTSPHLVDLTERVRIVDGRSIEPGSRSGESRAPVDLAAAGGLDVTREALRAAIDEVEAVDPGFEILTFFEVITAAAFLLMASVSVDVAVVECGLGARLDATRLVDAKVSVLTSVGLDHQQFLGDTLASIAAEKAAVIRSGRPLVSGRLPAEAEAVVAAVAEAQGSPRYRLGVELGAETVDAGWHLTLSDRVVDVARRGLGPHQVDNAAMAAQAAILLEPGLPSAAIVRGLASTRWAGRMEWVDGLSAPVLLDGAHNPDAAEALVAALREVAGPRRWHFVVGMMEDKNSASILDALQPMATSWLFTSASSPRAADPHRLAKLVNEGSVVPDPGDAVKAALARAGDDDGVVICGSLYLVGAVRSQLVAMGGRLAGDFCPVLR